MRICDMELGQQRKGWLSALILGLGLGVLGGSEAWSSAAPPRVAVENVRAGLGEASHVKLGAWGPAWVQLRAGTERFTGTLEVVTLDDDATPTSMGQAVDIAPGETHEFPVYIRQGKIGAEIEVRVRDRNGRPLARVTLPSDDLNELVAEETLLVTLGRPMGVELIPGFLSGQKESATPPPTAVENTSGVAVARIGGGLGGRWPGSWMGFDAADAIVIATNDSDVVATLATPRGQAIVDWVQRGGHLVVAVGANWQRLQDSALGPILPCVCRGRASVSDVGVLETYAGATR